MSVATRPGVAAAPAAPAGRDPVLRVGRATAIVTAVLCLAPLPVLLAVATTRTWQQGPFAGGVTGRWLALGWERIAPNAMYSARVAAVVLVLDLLIGVPAAAVLARRRFPGRRLVLAVTTLPVAVPGIALALALILAYPTARAGGGLVVAGHVLYTLPFLIGALVPAFGRPGLPEMEAVAASLGAGPVRRAATVTLPQVRAALLAATITVVTLSLGEFNVSFFLFSPLAQPLPVELYDGYVTGRLETAAAATVWFLLLVVPAAVALERLGGARAGQA